MIAADYPMELEKRLGVAELMDELEIRFDGYPHEHVDSRGDLRILRMIRTYLAYEMDGRRKLFKGTILDSTDCWTLTTLTHMLAARKGIKTSIARPKGISHYFHAMLIYNDGTGELSFNAAGRPRQYEGIKLAYHRVETILRAVTPVIRVANYLRCNNP